MSFTLKIANYTNSTTSENITDALPKAVDFTLGAVKKFNPGMLNQFAISVSSGNGIFADIFIERSIFELLDVDRKQGAISYWARPIDNKLMQKAKDSSSIYFATYHDPVYTITSTGILDLFPVESATNEGSIQYVPHSEGLTIDDANETIKVTAFTFNGESFVTAEHFPNWAKELVVLHAAECVLMERLADFRTNIPTALDAEWTDALAKAKLLFDSGAAIGGDDAGASMSVQYWLNDEDEDMASATLSAIQSEVGRAGAYLAKFKTDLEIVATDYQWTQGQLQMIASKKQEFMQIQLQAGIADDLKDGSAQ